MTSRERFAALWPRPLPVVGMVHLHPLPGAPGWGGSMEAVVDAALADARALAEGGVDGLVVENFGDVPFHPGLLPAETVAALAVVARAVAAAHPLPLGVNALRNDARAALAVAVAAGAAFVRVNVHTGSAFTDQGLVQGDAHTTLRLRRALDAGHVAVLADVHVKHATPPPGSTLEDAARDAWHRGLADGLLVTGAATGAGADPEQVEQVKRAVPEAPVWVASGVTPESAARVLARADGALVGSALQRGGRAGASVEPERVRRLVEAVEAVRRARVSPGG